MSSLLAPSEDEIKAHFKEKHKINTLKAFLIKRVCRICGLDKFGANDDLLKHIDAEHPRSDFCDDDSEDLEAEPSQEALEEELNYEPQSPSLPP